MSFVIRTNLGLATGISRSRQGLAIFFLIIDPYEFSKPFIDPHENNSLKIQIWDAERDVKHFSSTVIGPRSITSSDFDRSLQTKSTLSTKLSPRELNRPPEDDIVQLCQPLIYSYSHNTFYFLIDILI